MWPPLLIPLSARHLAVLLCTLVLGRQHRPARCRLLVKLGGSACTDKATFETVSESRLRATARQLAATRPTAAEDRVVLHGAGSFGHFHRRPTGPAASRSCCRWRRRRSTKAWQ